MITEIATIRVRDGADAAFEAAVNEAVSVFERAKGWRGLTLMKCVEEPNLYDVVIRWDTLEDHTVTFRNSELFSQWRALVGPHFAEPPSVKHYSQIF